MNGHLFVVLYSFSWAAALRILAAVTPECLTCFYSYIGCCLLSVVLAYHFYPLFKAIYFDERLLPHGKAVLITGCDSGFGHELAKRLDSKGFDVFAGCLFPDGDGAKKLKQFSSSRLRIIGLDLRKEESVLETLEYVKSNLGTSELWAVVNNAGVLKGFELAFTKIHHFQESFDVNTLGPVRIVKAFLPLLIKSKGRIVTVTSLGSRIIFPTIMTYTMSKWATRAFCETLRQEMRPWGIKVIEIEPEAFGTAMADRSANVEALRKIMNEVDDDIRELYGDEYLKGCVKFTENVKDPASTRLDKVVDKLEDAVSLQEPCNVYMPCRSKAVNVFLTLFKMIPSPIINFLFEIYKKKNNFPLPKYRRL